MTASARKTTLGDRQNGVIVLWKRVLTLLTVGITLACTSCTASPRYPEPEYVEEVYEIAMGSGVDHLKIPVSLTCTLIDARKAPGGLYVALRIAGPEECVNRLANDIGLGIELAEGLVLSCSDRDTVMPLKDRTIGGFHPVPVQPRPFPARNLAAYLAHHNTWLDVVQVGGVRVSGPLCQRCEVRLNENWSLRSEAIFSGSCALTILDDAVTVRVE